MKEDDPIGGEIVFGGVDLDYMGSNFTFFSVIPGTFWELQLEGIKIGNTSLNVCERLLEDAGKCAIAVDSGTSLIAGPSEFISIILDNLAVMEDCSNLKSLPQITFSIEGKDFILDPDDFVIKVLHLKKENETEYVRFLSNGDYSFCTPTFMALDVPKPRGPIFVLGASFLKRFYTVFDRGNNRIGFAKSKKKFDKRTENVINPYNVIPHLQNDEVSDGPKSLEKLKEEELKSLENKSSDQVQSADSMIDKIESLNRSFKNDLLLVSQLSNF